MSGWGWRSREICYCRWWLGDSCGRKDMWNLITQIRHITRYTNYYHIVCICAHMNLLQHGWVSFKLINLSSESLERPSDGHFNCWKTQWTSALERINNSFGENFFSNSLGFSSSFQAAATLAQLAIIKKKCTTKKSRKKWNSLYNQLLVLIFHSLTQLYSRRLTRADDKKNLISFLCQS